MLEMFGIEVAVGGDEFIFFASLVTTTEPLPPKVLGASSPLPACNTLSILKLETAAFSGFDFFFGRLYSRATLKS